MELGFRASRKSKIIFALFMACMTVCVFFPMIANADTDYTNYNSFGADTIEHIKVRTGFSQITRKFGFDVLCFLAKGASAIQNSVDTILKFNVVDIVKKLGITDGSSFGLSKPLVTTVFVIFLMLGSCTLIVFRSKIRLNDFFIGILSSAGMIIALPLLVSSFSEMRSEGLKAIETINESAAVETKSDLSYPVGDQILSASVYNIPQSARNGHLTPYTEHGGRSVNTVFSIDINAVAESQGFDKAVESVEPSAYTKQKEYVELSTMDKFNLLGLGSEYQKYLDAVANGQSEVVIHHTTSSIQEHEAQKGGASTPSDETIPLRTYRDQLWAKMCREIASLTGKSAVEIMNKTVTKFNLEECINSYDELRVFMVK